MPEPASPTFPPSTFPGSLYGMDPGSNCPQIVRMVAEIPKNSSITFEYDPVARTFLLDSMLYSPMHYPADYGFVPGTIAEDSAPLDVLCLIHPPTFTGCVIEVRPIGVLDLVDQTTTDHKIIAAPVRFERVRTIHDLAPHVVRESEHFFMMYKELEDKVVEARAWDDLDHALEIINDSHPRCTKAIQPNLMTETKHRRS